MIPLGFLAPGFLVGVAALAVPIAIHLIDRRKARVVDFPTLRFLREIDRRVARRRRIEEMLLLAARCGVVALVAMALARPLLRPTPGAGSGAACTLAVVIDDSASMRAVEGGVTRFEKARAAARAALETLHAGDRAALLFSSGTTFGPSADLDAARRALDEAQPSFSARPLPLEAAAALLAKADTSGRALVVAGDMQRGSSGEGKIAGDVDAWVVPVGAGALENASLAGLEAASPAAAAGHAASVRAIVVNDGDASSERTVTFLLDGRPLSEARVALRPRGRAVATAELAIPAGETGWHEVVARLDARDALRADDEAHLSLEVRDGPPILSIGASAGSSPDDDAFFLLRALEASGTPAGARSVRRDDAAKEKLESYALAVSFGAPPAKLVERLARGGSLLVVGAGEAVEHGAAEAVGLGALGRDDAIGEPLTRATPPVELGAARFFRTTRPALEPGDVVAARFTDGDPALIERAVGRGRMLLFNSGLTPPSTNFPLKVGFVPFVASAARWLAGGEGRAHVLVGGAIPLESGAGAPRALRVNGVERPIAAGVAPIDPPSEPGFVRLDEVDASGASHERRIAIDVDASEGDLGAPPAPDLVARRFERARIVTADGIAAALDRARRGVELGLPLLLVAAALLLFEAWLSNLLALGPIARAKSAPAPARAGAEVAS